MSVITADQEFEALKEFSRQIGADPLQVQGAGGNTSIKLQDTLWIKASGTWLQNAVRDDLFVPVTLSPLLKALDNHDPATENLSGFVISKLNPHQLRPSIETTVHAVMPQRVVVHTHCVDTIAVAVQTNAQQLLRDALKEFNYLWVPYYRPGLPLSEFIRKQRKPETDVVVLGNHGLVVAADSVAAVATLMQSVRNALKQPARTQQFTPTEKLSDYCAGSSYLPADDSVTNSIAFDHTSMTIASAGSLYPDHVIFLGSGTVIADRHEKLANTVERCLEDTGTEPVSIVVPDMGVLMKAGSNPGQHSMARCIADVTTRIHPGTDVHYLNEDNVYELLNWEAEHYRQRLNR